MDRLDSRLWRPFAGERLAASIFRFQQEDRKDGEALTFRSFPFKFFLTESCSLKSFWRLAVWNFVISPRAPCYLPLDT
jgi:hypothetical protein